MKKVVVIAGGGTGGHIYPGVAITRALMKMDADVEVHFVGTKHGLENQILPKEHLALHWIESGKFNVKSRAQKLKTIFLLPLGFWQSAQLLLQLKPVFVLGVGGYASGPFVLVASLLGFNTAVWEPNAMPGMANRWLSRFVEKCYVVFAEAESYLKNDSILKFGMPVRTEPTEAAPKTHIEGRKLRVLLFGGSQGSRVLNQCLIKAIETNQELRSSVEFVHQTGAHEFSSVKNDYARIEAQGISLSGVVDAKEYIYDMPQYYQWADAVICRGGASSLAEVASYGVVPICVPLPAADDHQVKNAQSFERAGAGVVILQKNLTPELLAKEILNLKNNESSRLEMSRKLKQLFEPGAALKIAKDIANEIATS